MFLYLVCVWKPCKCLSVCLSVCLSLLQKSVKAGTIKSYSFWTDLKRELEELVRYLGLSTVSVICTMTLPAGQWLRGYLLVAKWCECAAHHWALSIREVIAMRRILISPFFKRWVYFVSVSCTSPHSSTRQYTDTRMSVQQPLPESAPSLVLHSLHKWNSSKMLISRQESIYCRKKWRVPTHWKLLKISWTTGSPSHTLSMPRLWRSGCGGTVHYTPQRVFWAACLPSLLNILFKMYLFL